MAASVERFYGLSPKVATAAQSNLARCCCCCCCWSIVAVDFYCAEFDTYTSVYVLSRYSPLKDGQLYKCHTLSSGTCHLPLSTRHTHFCYSYHVLAAACCKSLIEFSTLFTLPQNGHQAHNALAPLSLARSLPAWLEIVTDYSSVIILISN